MTFIALSPLTIAAAVCSDSTASISGKIVDVRGQGMANILLIIKDTAGQVIHMTQSDQQGEYQFDHLAKQKPYQLELVKNDNWLKEINWLDLHIVSLTILDTLLSVHPSNLLAADVDDNGLNSTFDLVTMVRVLQLIENASDLSPAWRFVYAYGPIYLPDNSQSNLFDGRSIRLNGDISGLDFVGIKKGNLYQVE